MFAFVYARSAMCTVLVSHEGTPKLKINGLEDAVATKASVCVHAQALHAAKARCA